MESIHKLRSYLYINMYITTIYNQLFFVRSIARNVDLRPATRVYIDHWRSQVKDPHFLLLTSHRVINCFIITLFSYCCKFIVKPSNTNFIVYFDRINVIGYRRETGHTTIEHGLNPWSSTFKASKLWMFVLLCIFFLN
jgi:hypothetical protein